MKTSKSQFLLLLIFTLTLYQQSIQAQSGWILQPSIDSVNFYKIKFINSQTGFLVGGSNKIFKTTNSGETWSDYVIADSVNILNDISFVNQNTGFVAGGKFLTQFPSPKFVTSIVLKTTNCGNNWSKVYSDTNQNVQKIFSTISFSDENTGFVGGGGIYAIPNGVNCLFKTTNGGDNWTEINYNYPSRPRQMFFQNNSEGVAVMENRILKTSNGGINWTQTIQTSFFYGLYFLNNLTGYACGGNEIQGRSMIMKTTDSGNNWKYVLNDSDSLYNTLSSIYFTDAKTGYAVGYPFVGSFVIRKTTNEGETWGFQNSPRGKHLYSVQFLNHSTGFAVGFDGTILKTTNGGGELISNISNYSNEIPDGFVMYQNYPNPFNPSTTIKYQLPTKEQISIKVYNVLGNEIETLINEVQNAGIYEVNWNAANQPSGIYYYKIHTDRYSNTMKMLLLK